MKTVDFTDREMTFVLLSLKKYETHLLESEDEDMEDSLTDLLFIQSLQKKLNALKNAG